MGYVKIPAATNRTVDFTSSGTWTCPSGVYSAEFLVVGAGGGGGGGACSVNTNRTVGAGGGGGAVKKINLSVIPGTNYTITIGAKGTGSNNAVGTNGGYTEIVNGASVLIRSFGGQGGGASVTGIATLPTLTKTAGGGGGEAGAETTSASILGGAGGGAINGFKQGASWGSSTNNLLWGAEGTQGNGSTTTGSQQYTNFGAIGVDGFGAGGSGGFAGTALTRQNGGSSYNSGAGAEQTTTGASNGGAAVANTGCGGGGGAANLSTTQFAGGNGADGLVRITYFA